MDRYAIGVDFGTLSGRAMLVRVNDGAELAQAAFDYPHGVMEKKLPGGAELGLDWALQHPKDYIEVLENTIPAVIKDAGIDASEIVGIGTDFTACTILPIKADGTPLCFLPEFKNNPNAYVKLWKHHAAQDKANMLNEIAEKRGEKWLSRYGGKISSEWAVPKIWQVFDEAPDVYEAADYFIEAADWIIWQLTGVQSRNSCTAGYKAIWHKKDGYPSKDFFASLDPRMENLVQDKLNWPVSPLGAKAGEINGLAASLTGLKEGTAVAVGNVDAHVTVPALGIDSPGKVLAIMGTSTCHILLGEEERAVPGMCGVVEDGVYPGFYGYEAGQSCVGDHFAWFVDNCVPATYHDEAKAKGVSVHELLTEKAAQQRPGQSGLVALDWWNGNRSVLVDVDLTGMMLGMTLQTKPEDMYRALIEATAYGTRKIINTFQENGVEVNEFYASGGISQKNPMLMQIYADVLNMPVRIGESENGPALGSAIFGAVAAGEFPDIFTAARAMGKVKDKVYIPDRDNAALYNKLYAEYEVLHDYFGRGANDVMKKLKELRG